MILKKNSLNLISFPVGSYQCNCSILYSDTTREAIIIDPGNDHEFILQKIKDLNIKVKKLIASEKELDFLAHNDS